MTSDTTPEQQPAAAPRLAFLRSATVVAVGMAIMNVAAYGFTLIAVHRLIPEQFGAVTALLGLLLIGNVASLGLQASGARRIATHVGPGEAALADTHAQGGPPGGARPDRRLPGRHAAVHVAAAHRLR